MSSYARSARDADHCKNDRNAECRGEPDRPSIQRRTRPGELGDLLCHLIDQLRLTSLVLLELRDPQHQFILACIERHRWRQVALLA